MALKQYGYTKLCQCGRLGNLVFFVTYSQAEEALRVEEALRIERERKILRNGLEPTSVLAESKHSEQSFEEEVFEEEARPNEASQVEEILRLEREIEGLRRQKETREQTLTAHSLARLQHLRDQELLRLEEEACKAAQQFLSSLNFHEIDECVRNIESTLVLQDCSEETEQQERRRGGDEEEVDEGLGVDEEGFKDSPNPSEHGHSDGQRTSGIRTSDDSSEEDPYANDRVAPPPVPPTSVPSAYHGLACIRDTSYCGAQQEEDLIPPDEDSDYDADEYDESGIVLPPSMSLTVLQTGSWSCDQRSSMATSTSASSGAYRFSSEGAQSSVSLTHIHKYMYMYTQLFLRTHVHTLAGQRKAH